MAVVNNDAQANVASETVIPTTADEVSYGFTLEHQATRMGVSVEVDLATADPLDGTYTVVVETAVDDEAADGAWNPLIYCAVTFNDVGLYPIAVVQPIYDKVRVRVTNDAVNPERAQITARWMCDQPLETLDPTA